MTRFIIPILVALAIVGTAHSSWAEDEDSVLLNCQGFLKAGAFKPHSKNIRIARDGSWIDWHGVVLRDTDLPNTGIWTYVDEDPDVSLTTTIYIRPALLKFDVFYKSKDKVVERASGSCTPFENPLQIPE
jgi:hypothetical protein|tara:strand:- start:156 stop:545 length:390 start_codon:yes stop_codon:yes gene_type:complete